jgi:hypothetical protein
MYDRDEHIRRRAHEIWESEGRPHGREAEHWRQAESEVDADLPGAAKGAEAGAEPDVVPSPVQPNTAPDLVPPPEPSRPKPGNVSPDPGKKTPRSTATRKRIPG